LPPSGITFQIRSDNMATTAQDIFSAAMGLIDSVDTSSGETDTAANAAYKSRTLLILNVLRGETFPYSDAYASAGDGKRPVCAAITDFASDVGLDDTIAQTVLPFGLAAQLLLEENPSAASFFQQRYEELLARLGSGVPQSFEAIESIYGGIEYSENGRC
jgi:hypothetical protein